MWQKSKRLSNSVKVIHLVYTSQAGFKPQCLKFCQYARILFSTTFLLPCTPPSPPSVSIRCVTGPQVSGRGLNPGEDVLGLDHGAHRSLADSHSDTSYFISGFGLLPPNFTVINSDIGIAHIFLTFSALTLFNRVT